MRHTLVLAALLVVMTAAVLPGQYSRRRATAATATAGPYNGPAVSFSGTVKSLSKKEIIIDMDSEQSLTLRRSGKTKFFKDDKEIKAADIPVGTHVTLDATRDGDQKLSALKVMVAPATAPGSPAAAKLSANP